MFLRILGPLVVLFTLAVLGSGLALIALGPDASRTPFLGLLGYSVSALTVHQATFVIWAVVTGLHTLARLVPAFRIVTQHAHPRAAVPGRIPRLGLLTATLAAAGVAAAILLGLSGSWSTGTAFHHFDHHHKAESSLLNPGK